MYTTEYNIGNLTERPVVENWSYRQDQAGGSYKHLDSSFYVWADVNDRSGSQRDLNAKQTWEYGVRFVVRFNPYIKSNSTIIWGNARYTIESLNLTDDRFLVLNCSKIDGSLVSPVITVTMIYLQNYEGVGGETSVTFNNIIDKTLVGVYKDGIAFTIVTGSPGTKEVQYVSNTGTFNFDIPFYQDEPLIIQYI